MHLYIHIHRAVWIEVNCVLAFRPYRFKWARNAYVLVDISPPSSPLPLPRRCCINHDASGAWETVEGGAPHNTHRIVANLPSSSLFSAGTFSFFSQNDADMRAKEKAGSCVYTIAERERYSAKSLSHAKLPTAPLVPVRIPFGAFIDALPFMQETRSVFFLLSTLCDVCNGGTVKAV